MSIPFNKPYISGNEYAYIKDVLDSGKLSGNRKYTQLCQAFFEERYGLKKSLLTTSCTDALEMAAILSNIQPGDEVIIPSYTFVSTANAFVLRGAKVIFADSQPTHPNIDETTLEALITPKTKAISLVHYGGAACNMDAIMSLAAKHNLFVIEDAAQAIDAHYKGTQALGSIGHFAAFSFHETKNIVSGEGGMLAVNAQKSVPRSEIIWEKGTNRSAFYRGEVDKYNWVDVGSSFLPAEMIAAFLWAQLENIDRIQARRIAIWEQYYEQLKSLAERGVVELPMIPDFASNNAHVFYLVCGSIEERDRLLAHLNKQGVKAVFHYISLHSSPFFKGKHDGRTLTNCDHFSNGLLRLPLFYELTDDEVAKVAESVLDFYK